MNQQRQTVNNGIVFYQPDFLLPQIADATYLELKQTIDWQQESIMMFGRSVPQPRLQAWFGDQAYQYSGLRLDPKPMPTILDKLQQRCAIASGHRFNSVLLNLYRDGNDSMGWHQDNEPELGECPVIASISLGATRKFSLKHNNGEDKLSLTLTHGSLLIMAGELQQYWKHALPKSKFVNQPRINLTFRYINPT